VQLEGAQRQGGEGRKKEFGAGPKWRKRNSSKKKPDESGAACPKVKGTVWQKSRKDQRNKRKKKARCSLRKGAGKPGSHSQIQRGRGPTKLESRPNQRVKDGAFFLAVYR